MFKKKRVSKLMMMFMAVIMGIQMFAATAFAIGNSDTGTITVNGVEKGVSVSAYRFMNINYDYNVNQPKNPMYVWVEQIAGWMSTNYSDFIDEDNENAVNEAFSMANEDIIAEIYDRLAVAIKAGDVVLESKEVVASGETVMINNLSMGNYFLLIEGGAKVYRPLTANIVPEWKDNAWTMTAPVVSAKATEPTITKTVTDGLTEDNADIGDTISYELNALVPTYPENATAKKYMISDKLSEGLTLVEDSIKVYGLNSGKEDVLLDKGYEKTNERDASFTLDFDYAVIKSYESLKISYDTILNEKAVVGESGNENNVYLDYSNNPYDKESYYTDEDKTIVYTYGIKISKVDEKNGNGLSGAEFTLSKDGQDISFAGVNGNYHVAGKTENGNTVVVVDENGLLTLDGLDAGTYYLTEEKAPDGYVKLQNPVEITIVDENVNGKVESEDNELSDGYVPVTVKNDAGFVLPVTGGMGTTLFNVAGIVLMGSGVLLMITHFRKRNNSR